MSTITSEILLNANLAPNCGFRIEFCDACLAHIEDEPDAWLWDSSHYPCVSDGAHRPLVLCRECVEMVKRRGLRGLVRLITQKASRAQLKYEALASFANAVADVAAADVTIVDPMPGVEVPFE